MAGTAVTRQLPFVKMHGAGNDYVFVDGFVTTLPTNPSALAIEISDRNFGVGSDGLVYIHPPTDSSADVRMQMWNADGSEGSMCGNAARCVAMWMSLNDRVADTCRIETASRMVEAETDIIERRKRSAEVTVNMGVPEFDHPDEAAESLSMETAVELTAVSMGNPHAVLFVDNLTDELVQDIGSQIETHDRFPNGTNVEWVRVINETTLEVRVWERGSGETRACGSGACAVTAAAVARGLCSRAAEISIQLPGGTLKSRWTEDGSILLTGPAAVSFTGRFLIHKI